MRKLYCSILKKQIFHQLKRHSSYLFVTGDRASETFSAVKPFIDFDDRMKDVKELEENVTRRGLNVSIKELKEIWLFMNECKGHKSSLERNSSEIRSKLQELYSDPNKNEDEIKSLQIKLKFIKDDIKQVSKNVWDLENNAVIKALKIPNYLHHNTPDEDIVVESFNNKINSGLNHLEVGKTLNVLDYFSSSNYFLKDDLALFEIKAAQYFVDEFKKHQYVPTCNADFVRTVLLEGCTTNIETSDLALMLRDIEKDQFDKLYLAGGASFMPFYGYHAKRVTPSENLPVKFVAQGRQYNPKLNSDFPGLYSVIQSNAVEIFVVESVKTDITKSFNEVVQQLTSIYKSLGIHFQVVNSSASKLKAWESMHYSFQLYSPVHESYIEIGNVSLIGDYISKRLRAQHSTSCQNDMFLNVISGTSVRVPTLIAIILEMSKNELKFPDVIESLEYV